MTITTARSQFIDKLVDYTLDSNLDYRSFVYTYLDQPYIARNEPEIVDDHCIAEYYRVDQDGDQTIIKVRFELNQLGQELYDACGLKILTRSNSMTSLSGDTTL